MFGDCSMHHNRYRTLGIINEQHLL